MSNRPPQTLLDSLRHRLGPKGFSTDPGEMEPWLTDWRGRFRGAAAAMLAPSTTVEVSEAVRLCSDAGVALVPQGGNTSMVAGATPSEDGVALLLSMRRMNRIRSMRPEADLAVCEAGVILSHLHEAAAAVSRRFPLSLGAKGSATIGGLASTNAGGTQVLRFGTMRNLVQGLEAVLPDGSVFHGLTALKKDNRGYDLRQLLIGAEGTLGVITAASLRLVPAIGSRAVAWVGLGSPDLALKLLRRLEEKMGGAVESFELLPKDAHDLVLSHVAQTRRPLEGDHEWHVLVEAVAPSGAEPPEPQLARLLAQSIEERVAEDAIIAANEAQADALWRIRDSISEAERKDGPAAKHDISVEVSAMPAFMSEARRQVESRFHGCQVLPFGHLGDGNVHFNVRAPSGAGSEWLSGEAREVTRYVHDLVVAAGGSISAEHGIGQARLEEFARLEDAARLSALRLIKKALDPKGIMNPGKLVPLAECA